MVDPFNVVSYEAFVDPKPDYKVYCLKRTSSHTIVISKEDFDYVTISNSEGIKFDERAQYVWNKWTRNSRTSPSSIPDQLEVDILGSKWTIKKVDFNKDKTFHNSDICAYCNMYTRTIFRCDMKTYPCEWKDQPESVLIECEKQNLRHEIVHAFLFESGLNDNSSVYKSGWATNEEMVDWFALQGPKIYKAWQDANCL